MSDLCGDDSSGLIPTQVGSACDRTRTTTDLIQLSAVGFVRSGTSISFMVCSMSSVGRLVSLLIVVPFYTAFRNNTHSVYAKHFESMKAIARRLRRLEDRNGLSATFPVFAKQEYQRLGEALGPPPLRVAGTLLRHHSKAIVV
jgi:hypothetical protein